MSGYSIIIPAYNEENNIISTLEAILANSGNFEIILVDDGSTDNTYQKAASINGVVVLRHNVNRGYGAALKTGIEKAKYPIVVITDADLTYPNKKIPSIVEKFEKENCDMVVCSRTGDTVEIPFIRRLPKWILKKLAEYLMNSKVPDLNSGLRAISKEEVMKHNRIICDGFSFTTTITIVMFLNKKKVEYIPINYFKRGGKSKIRPIRDTLNFIQIIIRTSMYFEPLRIFIPFSILLFILSILVLVSSQFFFGKVADVTFGVTLMTAVIVLAIGMLADLIVKKL
jgi:glycosyltransferase involved in cell wall biosynthesis